MTNGAATFSVQKPAVLKRSALECEVCCLEFRFADLAFFKHMRGLMNNFSTICKFRVCNGGNSHYDRDPPP
jgi:hypothetical protein